MISKLEELTKEYLAKTNQNKSKMEMYALMGASGVSPKVLKSYEESIEKIETYTVQFDHTAQLYRK